MIFKEVIYGLNRMFYRDEEDLIVTIFWNSLYISFFLLPLGINLPTPFFVISILLGLINIFRTKRNFFSDSKVLWLFPIYFIIISISMIYTENIQDGMNLLQRSLSLLFFPIIFLFVKEDASSVRKLFDFLLLGILVSFFINFAIGIYDTLGYIKRSGFFLEASIEGVSSLFDATMKGWSYFIRTDFSKLINSSYVSLYILLVLSYYLKNKLQSRVQVIIVFVLFFYLFLLASIAAYLILLIMCLLLIFNISDKSKKYTMSLLFFLGVIVFLNNPRVFNFYKNVTGISDDFGITTTTIEKSRLLTWNASLDLIKEAPIFGYGIGDTNDVLTRKYKELNYFHNYENKYNAHNQFLQTFLQTGILGFGVLITIFVLLAIRMWGSKNEFSVFLILFISLFFESMLVRFNGIVFFSIIIPLLLKKRSILSSRIIRN
ncbi:O-antigen ligase family protein [Aquimarina spongiae]|nr:O-antigen ligase family protein [Aquimarina spongiae]